MLMEKFIIKQKKLAGFSLVELLVVVGVIGTLASIGIPMYKSYKARARRAECLSTLPTIMHGARIHMMKTKHSPCRIGVTSSAIGPYDDANCNTAGRRQIPFPNIEATAASIGDYYYAYGVRPAGFVGLTTVDRWFPLPGGGDNRFSQTIDPGDSTSLGIDFSDAPQNAKIVVSCIGRITSGGTLDEVSLLDTGTFRLIQDEVTGVDNTATEGVPYK